MNQQTCRINTGDFVGSAFRGPHWTPYAEGIANHYPIQAPWYLTMQQTLTLAVVSSTQTPFVQITRPQLYDVLILGMSALITGDVTQDNGNSIYLQITDLETGIPWVAPNTVGYAPVASFASINDEPSTGTFFPMPVLKLPEAYFLPKGTRLKLDWFPLPESLLVAPNLTVTLTMVGVQLINHASGFKAPRKVTMPNGNEIEVGSRVPWFGCVPFGRRSLTAASARFLQSLELPPGEEVAQFLPPVECPVELHDAYANFLAQTVTPITDKTVFKVKLQDMRSSADFTPELSQAVAIFGNEEQVFPTLPFVKPHLLKPGHRTGMVLFNNSPLALTLNRATVVIRGVRLCEY